MSGEVAGEHLGQGRHPGKGPESGMEVEQGAGKGTQARAEGHYGGEVRD